MVNSLPTYLLLVTHLDNDYVPLTRDNDQQHCSSAGQNTGLSNRIFVEENPFSFHPLCIWRQLSTRINKLKKAAEILQIISAKEKFSICPKYT